MINNVLLDLSGQIISLVIIPHDRVVPDRHLKINPLTAKLFNLNFHSLEVVSRRRDPQLQVSENYSDLTKWRSTLFKSCRLMSHFIFNIFKMWYLMCWWKMKPRIYAAPEVKGLKGLIAKSKIRPFNFKVPTFCIRLSERLTWLFKNNVSKSKY